MSLKVSIAEGHIISVRVRDGRMENTTTQILFFQKALISEIVREKKTSITYERFMENNATN